MHKIIFTIIIFISSLFMIFHGCSDNHLRGAVSPSPDGKTYLSILDDNGGQCGRIFVDGKIWEYSLNEKSLISPGIHTIKCGTEIKFEIPEGVIFEFDYWGPWVY